MYLICAPYPCANFIHCAYVKTTFIPYCSATTVRFERRTYSVDEDDGPAQPALILSNPSSTDITVQVLNTDGTTTGEYCSILINYNGMTNMLQEEVLIMVLDHTLSHFLLDRHVLHSMFQ